MPISRDILLAGLRQLNAKYRKPQFGVTQVTVQMINGTPAYVLHGVSPRPTEGVPGKLVVPDDRNQPVAVAVLWRQAQTSVPLVAPSDRPVLTQQNPTWLNTPDRPNKPMPPADEEDVSRSMWAGYSKIDRRDTVTEYSPGSETVITQTKIPEATVDTLRISVDVTGDWGFWSKPLDLQGCLCCTNYAVSSLIFAYTVPADYTVVIDSWAFLVYGTFSPGEVFNVRFVRDGETLLSYDEVIVDPLNADPGQKCLFSGSVEQVMSTYMRFDRNQTITVFVTPKGLYPYVNGPLVPFCGTICCLLHGHREALLDNRDGTPRPKDVGRIRDDLWGTATLNEVSADDVQQLMTWLSGASADAAPSGETIEHVTRMEPSTEDRELVDGSVPPISDIPQIPDGVSLE